MMMMRIENRSDPSHHIPFRCQKNFPKNSYYHPRTRIFQKIAQMQALGRKETVILCDIIARLKLQFSVWNSRSEGFEANSPHSECVLVVVNSYLWPLHAHHQQSILFSLVQSFLTREIMLECEPNILQEKSFYFPCCC